MTPSDHGDGPLHVPSPDWRDQIVYFLLTDRFAEGNPSISDQGYGEYDPTDPRCYSGGDLQGITDHLEYIQALGATSVWITPPVAVQWWNPRVAYGGYHGYWARHFAELDEHVGDLTTYQALSRRLHARGMYLIQDIVCNHTGDFFSYEGPYSHADPCHNFALNTDSIPTTKPTQAPFHRNDVREPDQRAEAIYHWTPTIEHPQDPTQRLEYSLYDLDDLNTSNPVVRDALKRSYAHWIREVGVDAYRIDTAYHVEPEFWRDFIHAGDGMQAVAAETGRTDFFCFGEILLGSDAYEDSAERVAQHYMGTARDPVLDSVISFPWYFTVRRVIAEGKPTEELAYRIRNQMRLYADPLRVPTFLDNHDVDRFAAVGGNRALCPALVLLLTAPGMPILYYGTEQGFTERRPSMFPRGWGSDGVNAFDQRGAVFQLIANLATLRHGHAVFRRGDAEPVASNSQGAGLFALRRRHAGTEALIILNTAKETATDRLQLDTPGTTYRQLLALDETTTTWAVEGAELNLSLPPQGALVLFAD